ncbi:hypothetical protein KQX54_017475 [Cotesia glomerata]|uniref:Uncharacterized protein n=1 Tax=Cotesia glomerata TaxID=32391 RepID=A0AAV7HZW9_COTGL|nr:hypothetical protein KQX54_017475 [Cotesia glomerata]
MPAVRCGMASSLGTKPGEVKGKTHLPLSPHLGDGDRERDNQPAPRRAIKLAGVATTSLAKSSRNIDPTPPIPRDFDQCFPLYIHQQAICTPIEALAGKQTG